VSGGATNVPAKEFAASGGKTCAPQVVERDGAGGPAGDAGDGPLLDVAELTVHFKIRRGITRKSIDVVHAADEIGFVLQKGTTLALVGESGSGKTTVAHAVLGLNKPESGSIVFLGKDVLRLPKRERRAARHGMQVVFQDPYSSLNPRMTVHDLIAEPLRVAKSMKGDALRARVVELLELVGLGTQHLWRRPHEFSGGQCQRIAIARALALQPDLLVLDEPTSALDVSVQARILTLLHRLQEELTLSYLFIAHDLALVESVADQVAVMYLGRIVESGSSDVLFGDPRHPYTLALLASVPSPDPLQRTEKAALSGDVPSAIDPPKGCRFHPRCKFRMEVCEQQAPEYVERQGRLIACHLPADFDLSAEQEAARVAMATRAENEAVARRRARPRRNGENDIPTPRMRRRW
jgi:oligopeptide/dipeptide ABC transporter ATP-binding protein